jgi:hypothetical protein
LSDARETAASACGIPPVSKTGNASAIDARNLSARDVARVRAKSLAAPTMAVQARSGVLGPS